MRLVNIRLIRILRLWNARDWRERLSYFFMKKQFPGCPRRKNTNWVVKSGTPQSALHRTLQKVMDDSISKNRSTFIVYPGDLNLSLEIISLVVLI